MLRVVLSLCFLAAVSLTAAAEHRVLLPGGDRLAIVEPDGSTSWQMPWGGIHDIHWLPNGNILTRQGAATVVEIDPETKQVRWQYDSQAAHQGRRVQVHAFQPLSNGSVMIAESGSAQIIEVDREGNVQKTVPLVVENPDTHSDTRLARKLDSGTYLVAHEADGKVREYDSKGNVVWEYEVPLFSRQPAGGHGPEAFGNRLFTALRLPSGNTLIATGNGHSVLEVTPEKEVIWELHQEDLPGIRLAWVTTLEVLPNGNYVIGNCHAGAGQPLLVEIEPKTKQVVWTFDRFDDFGNNVSNSQLLDVAKTSIR